MIMTTGMTIITTIIPTPNTRKPRTRTGRNPCASG